MKNIYYLAFVAIIGVLASCQKEDKPGGTSTQAMSGDWYVQVSDDGGQTFSTDYYTISTYNTAANDGKQVWLDDLESYWDLKGKVNINVNSLTFSADNIDNEYYPMTFKVTNGKILKNAAKSSGTKTVTDSLYFKAEFSDDPGTEYIFSGYKKTRFLEDEH